MTNEKGGPRPKPGATRRGSHQPTFEGTAEPHPALASIVELMQARHVRPTVAPDGGLIVACPVDGSHAVRVCVNGHGDVDFLDDGRCYLPAVIGGLGLPQRAEFYRVQRHRSLVEDQAERMRARREAARLIAAEEHAGAENTWAAVDLTPFLDGTHKAPQATLGLARLDMVQLLYPGLDHSVIGEMEAGKSWFALACVAAVLKSGQRVVYVHFEEADAAGTIDRLLSMDVPAATIERLFTFIAPAQPVTPEYLAPLLSLRPTLVILDGVNEAMVSNGWAVNDTDGAGLFRSHLVAPFLRVGAATLSCDHVVKNKEMRGRYALGAGHKGNGMTGPLILLENAEPFGRTKRGRSHVYVTKDRPGQLRRHGKPTKLPGKTFMGTLIVDDTREWDPWLTVAIVPPKDDGTDDATGSTEDERAEAERQEDDVRVMAAVVELHRAGVPTNVNRIEATVRRSGKRTQAALTRLTLAGKLREEPGRNRARLFFPSGGDCDLETT